MLTLPVLDSERSKVYRPLENNAKFISIMVEASLLHSARRLILALLLATMNIYCHIKSD